VAGKLLFDGGLTSKKVSSSGGKGTFTDKGGSEYTYYADMEIALASGSASEGCGGILNVWDQSGKLANQNGSSSYTIPTSGGAFIPVTGQSIQLDLGVFYEVPYSVTVNDYASGGLNTISGTTQVKLVKVSGVPAAGQYAFNPATGAYTFSSSNAGLSVSVVYSCTFSLYYYQRTEYAQVPAVGPYTYSPSQQTYWYSDQGVSLVNTGMSLNPGAGTNGYSIDSGVYTFTSDLAGEYVRLSYTYTSSDSQVSSSSYLNLTLFNGAVGQAPWSFMRGSFPGEAIAYTGVCYVGADPMYLGYATTPPSYNYEVVGLVPWGGGIIDAHPCDGLALLLTDAFVGVGFPVGCIGDWSSAYNYWAANNYFVSILIDTQTTIASAFKAVIETGNVAAVWSGGQLKLISYGDVTCAGNGYTFTPNTTPAVTLTNDDLLPSSETRAGSSLRDDPIQIDQRAPQDCWNYVQAQWCNRGNDYNNDLINAQNDDFIQLYTQRMESAQTWDWITTKAAASWALNLRLKRQCYIRNTYKFWLAWWFGYLEPMDMVILPTGEAVRITQTVQDAAGRIEITAEEWAYGMSHTSIYSSQSPVSYSPIISQADPGDASSVIFEASPTAVISKTNCLQIAAAGNNPNWGGCYVYVSYDGTEFTKVATINSVNRAGVLTADLPVGSDPDTSGILSVDMSTSGGTLTTVSLAEANTFDPSLCAIVNSDETMELISFETATPVTTPNRYNLTYLRRGVYGTTIADHPICSEFSFIGVGGVLEYQYPYSYIGKTVYFKFPSFNLVQGRVQDITTLTAKSYVIGGKTSSSLSGTYTTNPTNPVTASLSGGVVSISVAAFTATLDNLSCPVNSGVLTTTGSGASLAAGHLYYVYYIDRIFSGGAVTFIATDATSDFTGNAGYYLVGSVITPTSGSSIYRPSAFLDAGNHTTSNAPQAYDGNLTTFAGLTGEPSSGGGDPLETTCEFFGMPARAATATMTLSVVLKALFTTAVTGSVIVNASFDGGVTFTNMIGLTASTPQVTYTMSVPSGTSLSSVQVVVDAQAFSGSGTVSALVYEINIQ
jgi:hypothetical protein